MLNIQDYYAKLANNEAVTQDEVVALLKELAHFRKAAAHLASCQAATLEALPKSASKSARGRHIELCATAAALLDGDISRVRYPTEVADAANRCRQAVADNEFVG